MNLKAIQEAIQAENLDGWLFFDHHQRDLLAYRVLGLPTNLHASRRWYFFVPAHGEPRKLVHRIESGNLDPLDGTKALYSSWDTQSAGLSALLKGAQRVAMQYSPRCAIPYVSMVDAGTIELIRSFNVDVVSSANLIQLFEARWSSAQFETHVAAGRIVDSIRRAAFEHVAALHRLGQFPSEYDVQQFIMQAFNRDRLLTDHPPIVAVNDNASNPHYCPVANQCRKINPADSLLIDLWAKLDQADAVFYDVTWMGFCGKVVPSALENVFAVARDARDLAVTSIQAACVENRLIRGFEVDDVTRGFIRNAGYGEYFVHRTGHSIGVEVHGNGANMDNLETHDDRPIIPNTCFSIEPGIYLPEFGVRTEVNVFVGEGYAKTTGEVQKQVVLAA